MTLSKKILKLGVLISVFAFWIFAHSAFAQTNVSGVIDTDTTWTLANSPYVVDSDLSINSAIILTIEPGVIVKFSPSARITMDQNGVMHAMGTSTNKIYFTSLADDEIGGDTNGDGNATVPDLTTEEYFWSGIYSYAGNSGITFNNVVVRYADRGFSLREANGVQITDSIFEKNSMGIEDQGKNSVNISNSEIKNNNVGLSISQIDSEPNSTYAVNGLSVHGNTYSGVSYSIVPPLAKSNSNPFIWFANLFKPERAIAQTAYTVDFKNTWWGDASGPTNADNPSGLGDVIDDNGFLNPKVLFDPWLTADPADQTCTTNCFSNVLFLPGLMGSRLYEQGGSVDCGIVITGSECFFDKELWVSTSDSSQANLTLNNQGKSINNIYTKNDTQKLNGDGDETGIVDDVYNANIYQSFIADLKKWKDDDKVIEDYAFIPYDWRLSLDDVITNGSINTDGNLAYDTAQNFSESFILKKLEALQSNSRSGKVTIIAHSNGGLVAKALIQKLKDTNNPLYDKIDKVILVAVPQVGTPDAFIGLLHGSDLGHGFIMDADRSRQLSENMPTVYNLLPSAGYFTTVDPAFAVDKLASFENVPFFNPQTSQYGIYVSNETELKNYILGTDSRTKPSFSDTVHPNIGNSALYSQAQSVHQILDSWQPSPDTKVIQVAGWGEETLAGLDYIAIRDTTEHLSYKPRHVVDGDGTVVVPSALWMSDASNVERWWVDLEEESGFFSPRKIHRNILEVSNLRDFIKARIENSTTFSDPENIVVNNASTLVSSDLRRLHYTLHSPLTLGITDLQGRYTGQDPVTKEVKEEIPNVTYKRIGDVQFISAPEGVAYILEMNGYEPGNFALDVDRQQGNTITDFTSFQGIPSSISTVATVDIPTNFDVSNSTLKIDQNGDGTVDKTLQATPDGVTVYDITPPELQVTFNINTKNVVFSAQDNSDPNPTINITNTSASLADNAENTTIIPFTKFKEKPHKLKFSFNNIVRNGVSANLHNIFVEYNWKEPHGILTDLDTKVVIKGVEKYMFRYNKSQNVTIIKEKINNHVQTKIQPGFVVVTVKTEGDSVKVTY